MMKFLITLLVSGLIAAVAYTAGLVDQRGEAQASTATADAAYAAKVEKDETARMTALFNDQEFKVLVNLEGLTCYPAPTSYGPARMAEIATAQCKAVILADPDVADISIKEVKDTEPGMMVDTSGASILFRDKVYPIRWDSSDEAVALQIKEALMSIQIHRMAEYRNDMRRQHTRRSGIHVD